eukprot:TRINITY_DN8917_c0_g1_i3.p2 TRINITY_DN8917_c0_g1~~TRINITY_DN8917_c0_g1_i3.p2  ORF type:complete len:207 (-),score=3.16 TRINITY_DN8917_c0_g1_i3:6-626(-)
MELVFRYFVVNMQQRHHQYFQLKRVLFLRLLCIQVFSNPYKIFRSWVGHTWLMLQKFARVIALCQKLKTMIVPLVCSLEVRDCIRNFSLDLQVAIFMFAIGHQLVEFFVKIFFVVVCNRSSRSCKGSGYVIVQFVSKFNSSCFQKKKKKKTKKKKKKRIMIGYLRKVKRESKEILTNGKKKKKKKDRKSTRLNSSHQCASRMPSSA